MFTNIPYTLQRGAGPLLVSIPHCGVMIPEEINARLTQVARLSSDTDWHLGALYRPFLAGRDVTIISAHYSRYVIDLNRPANDRSLYPGQATTGLIPTTDFEGVGLYTHSDHIDERERQDRLQRYWVPYHTALSQEIDRLRGLHEHVLIWEAHSIKSVVSRLFEGRLPDLNLGTHQGASCVSTVQSALEATLDRWSDRYTSAMNGRFKGGYITRQYGAPNEGVHTVQLELSQATYLEDESALVPLWNDRYADDARAVIVDLIKSAMSGLSYIF